MATKDLDAVHSDRIKAIAKRSARSDVSISELFMSERVVGSFASDINFMRSYRPDEILALLPFSENLFVSVCPGCVRKENFDGFKKFVERGAIIPVLTSSYKIYPEHVAEFISSHDHMSVYEYRFYRQTSLHSISNKGVCSHCVQKASEQALSYVKKKRNFEEFKDIVERIDHDLWPFIRPDFELVEATVEICRRGDLKGLRQLENLAQGVNAVRTAQAFDAPILLRSDEFDQLPEGVVGEGDQSYRVNAEMKRYALDGLGLRIPVDIGIENYIDLISDYRPAITKILNGVVGGDVQVAGTVSMTDVQKEVIRINAEIERIKGLRRTVILEACVGFYKEHPQLINTGLAMSAFGLAGSLWGCAGDVQVAGTVSMTDVQKEVIRINAEIERIKGLRRTVILEACVGFYKEHPQLINTGLAMSAFGLAGSLWGCAATGSAQVVKAVTKKLRGGQELETTRRLKETVKRDLKPVIDKLISAYVGADTPSVNVLSLRRTIQERSSRPVSAPKKQVSRARAKKAT